ncbi:uncharacterized protein LOC135847732 isoform X3 [Planococcus citri]|uniref:uncharacterized protein LOC135847732 isoform X3 n=1 Tax=Planococcus citri TaxID=170843 RepID=UPI0031F8D32D
MEVQQHQEVEMAEVTSKVYDIIHPTPVSLKQLSAIVISLEIWRRKINEYRTSQKLSEFDPGRLRKENTRMKTMLPDLPSTIYKMIEEVFSRFGYSMKIWRFHHYESGFCYQYSHENYVLEYFDDFVCDYDGSIHYARTAERMMRCEGFNSEMKFTVACTYFFENDIRQIWPSVSRNMNVDVIDFDEFPQLYYWICRLSNDLDKIETWGGETVDEKMLRACMPYNRPSIEYFWNRIPIEKQMRIPVGVGALSSSDFVRYILPKMDDQQLDKFFNDSWDGNKLYHLFLYLHCDEWMVLRTWLHIRNIIKESIFSNCIVSMLEYAYPQADDDPDECDEVAKWHEFHEPEKWEYLCCQIWNRTPLNLKQSAIRLISSDSTWIEDISNRLSVSEYYDSNEIKVEFLLVILRDASLKERSSFWHISWISLINVVRSEDLQRMVQLCFKNDDEITQIKQNFLITNSGFLKFCVTLLEDAHFEKLNALVSFCCPESQAARNLKQRLLQSVFLDEDSEFSPGIVVGSADLKEFVNDAFDDVDASSDFKNLLMSSSSNMKSLSSIICDDYVSFEELTEFIGAFVSTEEALTQIKMSMIDSLKEYLTTNVRTRKYSFAQNKFNSILLWCLGNNEHVEEFKSSLT